MKIIFFISRCIDKIKRTYRKRVFYEKTGQSANLIGEVILINRNIKVGKNVTIYPYVQFFGDGLIELGDNVSIGTGTIIYASKNGGVRIGDNSMVAGQCYIIDTDHGTKFSELIRCQENTSDAVTIGVDCWIAANVVILKGSVINDGAIIGANSLVKGDIEPYSINVGTPARKVKLRAEL